MDRAGFRVSCETERDGNPSVSISDTITCPLNKTLIQTASQAGPLCCLQSCRPQITGCRRMTSTILATVSRPSPLKPLAVTLSEGAGPVHYRHRQLKDSEAAQDWHPLCENMTRLWELLSMTLQRANALALMTEHMLCVYLVLAK